MLRKILTPFITFACLSIYNISQGQTYFTQSAVNNNYSQARDLNVINGSSNPDTAHSISNSIYGADVATDWNGWKTLNMPSGVSYGMGFTFANAIGNTNSTSTYAVQFLGATDDSSLYYRFNVTGYQTGTAAYNGWGPWCRIWNSMDDGLGSGLDADLIRGSVPQWSSKSNGNVYNTNSGYVGIGTANPQSLLAVSGSITAKQVTVTQTGWSDFVFDNGYHVMTLDKVEDYIRKNKHLPAVPSSSQIEQKGLDLGNMEKLHMQKIEELTLYLIDAGKQIKDEKTAIGNQHKLLVKLRNQLELQQQEIAKISRILHPSELTKLKKPK